MFISRLIKERKHSLRNGRKMNSLQYLYEAMKQEQQTRLTSTKPLRTRALSGGCVLYQFPKSNPVNQVMR